MAIQWLAFALLALVCCQSTARAAPTTTPRCRCAPGADCWPQTSQWNAFNTSLGGNLVPTVPVGAPCHQEEFGPYSSQQCENIRSSYFGLETHLESSSSVMAPYFTDSCNPFLAPETPCTIGNFVRAAARVSSVSDIQKTLEFVRKHNLRVVIKNTGHDYQGKSTGAHAVSIWTHYLKDISLVPDYQSPGYRGMAVKMGAGVNGQDAYAFAHSKGITLVGGNCPTVGLVGGWAQGGGHGRLASMFGLGSDQVLAWEVVLASGEVVLATPHNRYADLFWAMSGGGGGTYGVAVSMTVKAHAAIPVISSATLSFSMTGETVEQFWDVVDIFHQQLPAWVDARTVPIWAIVPPFFLLSPITAPGMSQKDLDLLIQPVLERLDSHGIQYQYSSRQDSSFLDSYNAHGISPATVADNHLGGRLVGRAVVEQNSAALTAVVRQIVEGGTLLSGVGFNVSQAETSPSTVAANPYWRKSIFNLAIGGPVNFTNWDVNEQRREEITSALRLVEELDPHGGAYLNEADYRQPDWQTLFYGENYDKLVRVKAKYDPQDMFYALTAVGSDKWTQEEDGKLCRV